MYNINNIRRWMDLDYCSRMFRDILAPNDIPLVIPMRPGTFERPCDWWDSVELTDFIFLRTGGGGAKDESLGPALDTFMSGARAAKANVGVMTFSSMPVPRKTMLKCATKMVEECKYN